MDCLLHYRFRFTDEAELLRVCFEENGIEYREMDNLILLSSPNLSFNEVAICIYQKLMMASLSKADYLYLYTVSHQNQWFCIIIKKIGHSRMYNIISRLKSTVK